MQVEQIVETKKMIQGRVNRCIYCGSTSYGKGCRYGPGGVHFHPDDPKKCSYCGSPNYGRGCRLNPHSDIHLHGINFNSMIKENLDTYVKSGFIGYLLNKKITEFKAYKLGLIDQNGNKIKEPKTVLEQAALTPEIKTILKVKRFLGSKIDLLNYSALLEGTNKALDGSKNYQQVLIFEEKIKDLYEQLYKTIDEGLEEGLTAEQIEAML